MYRGRLAPSPTGLLHLGHARTYLVAWLRARQAMGKLVLRIEDLDPPRTVPGSADAIVRDLEWLGLDWDEGPHVQSERSAHYEAALAQLQSDGYLFSCTCSRKEIAAVSSAPHGDHGPRYPGTCRDRPSHPDRPAALRFRFPDDDFVVKRADGLYAYQLAVVVDDIAMGITEVVRGADLASSTPRQIALYEALGATPPSFLHVPLVVDATGERLSKRSGSIAIEALEGLGRPAILGALARSLGLDVDAPAHPRDLLASFDPARIPSIPVALESLLKRA